MLKYQETPVQEILDPVLDKAELRLLIKREDLNHRLVPGNKWWKLKYNLAEAIRTNKKTLLTYGGAYSNHIAATSAAAAEIGLSSVGIIRGEETHPCNPVLAFARKHGMELYYISRAAYRKKSLSAPFLKNFGDFYFMPEGGSNLLAVKGVKEFASSLQMDYDYLCCAIGTGGTFSGLIEGVSDNKKLIGFPVLKGGEFLIDEIKKKLSDTRSHSTNWKLMFDYHYGGYAKKSPELTNFITHFTAEHQVPLEFIYTGKMMIGIYDLIKKGFFKHGSTILAIHTGGVSIR